MNRDPAGLYARLGVDPSAPLTAIRAAFRRKARILHPDVPKTGNAVAFVWVKEAYEVLSDPRKRAAYDRSGRRTTAPVPLRTEPEIEEVPMLWPKFSDLPLALWIGFGAVFCLASGMAVYEFTRPASHAKVTEIRPAAPTVVPLTTAQAHVVTVGVATHYVLPGGGAAMVWQHDAARDAFLPAGRVADFTSVEVLGILADSGLVGIRLADGGAGFIDPDRLAPGDQNTAHRAYCAYNAGAPPSNGEVLSRRGNGSGRLTVENRGSEPTVVKLRGEDGQTVISVFVKAGNATTVTNLPAQPYRPDFAVGELWSRACDAFTAGMRAQRFVDYGPLESLSPLVVPPSLSVSPAPVDIPDAAFGQD
jgi:hypothetical protein